MPKIKSFEFIFDEYVSQIMKYCQILNFTTNETNKQANDKNVYTTIY